MCHDSWSVAYLTSEDNDVNVMTEKGFTTVPMLEVNGTVMDYKTAFNYVEYL